MSLKIRPADINDAESLAALGTCVWIATYAADGLLPAMSAYLSREFSPVLYRVRIRENRRQIWVAEFCNHIIGSCEAILNSSIECGSATTELDRFYLLPSFQGKGVGKKIFQHICEALKTLGIPSVRLSVLQTNYRAVRFYKRLGFTKCGECDFCLGGNRHRNDVMQFQFSAS